VADGVSILDAGCGFGGTVASLNERFSGLEMIGLNIDPRQLERAAARVLARPDNQLRWRAADACSLPYAMASPMQCWRWIASFISRAGRSSSASAPGCCGPAAGWRSAIACRPQP